MTEFSPLLGAGVGVIFGYGAWAAARRFMGRDAPAEARIPGVALSSGLLPALGMAAWGAYVFWRMDALAVKMAIMVSAALLLSILLVDFAAFRIPDLLVGMLLAWGGVQAAWMGHPPWRSAALGALIGGGLFWVLAWIGQGGLGMGDVKFMAAEGALLGFPLILQGMFWGILFGGVAALILLATKRAGRKDRMAYGPYLVLAAWLVYLMTWNLLPWQS